MKNAARLVGMGTSLFLVVASRAQWISNYSFQRLGLTDAIHTGPTGNHISITVGMNDAGQVIGTSRWWYPNTNDGLNSAWVWTINQGMLRIGPNVAGQPTQNVIPVAQSATGVVVGNVLDANLQTIGYAWVWDRAVGLQSINLGGSSNATNMTSAGTAVGTAQYFSQGNRAWFWRASSGIVLTDLTSAPHVASNGVGWATVERSIDTTDGTSSWIIGTNARYNAQSVTSGVSAWVRSTNSPAPVQIGLYSSPYNDTSGSFTDYSAYPLSVNADGLVAGYNRLSFSFTVAWSWSPVTGITVPIGLTDTEHTGLSPSWRSGLANMATSTGLVIGWQRRFNGSFADRGISPYVWFPSTNTYAILGLQDAEHTSEDNTQWSIGALANGNHVAGYSYRYYGNDHRGQSTWYWHPSTGVRRIGLLGPEYFNPATQERRSEVLAISSDGAVLGFSVRYQPPSPSVLWKYDPSTDVTTALPGYPDFSVSSSEMNQDWPLDRLTTGAVVTMGQSGAAWLPQNGVTRFEQLVPGGMPGFSYTTSDVQRQPRFARHMPGRTGIAFSGTGRTVPNGEYAGFVLIPPANSVVCNDVDFNNDTSIFDPMDIGAFLSVYSEGPCMPATATCDSIDFNNDTSLFDPCDIDSFLLVYSEGPCTACGF